MVLDMPPVGPDVNVTVKLQLAPDAKGAVQVLAVIANLLA
jgi:hypothetical protein